jgi:hypothetical protein
MARRHPGVDAADRVQSVLLLMGEARTDRGMSEYWVPYPPHVNEFHAAIDTKQSHPDLTNVKVDGWLSGLWIDARPTDDWVRRR